MLRVSEGKEGVMGEMRVGVRQPAPEAKGATANTAIEHARSASGSSGETAVERGRQRMQALPRRPVGHVGGKLHQGSPGHRGKALGR